MQSEPFLQNLIRIYLSSWASQAGFSPPKSVDAEFIFVSMQMKNLDSFAQLGVDVLIFLFRAQVALLSLTSRSAKEDVILTTLLHWKYASWGPFKDFVRFIESLSLFCFLSKIEVGSHDQ